MWYRLSKKRCRQGQATTGVIIASTIGIGMALTLMRSISVHRDVQRGIAANADLDEISMLFHLLTDSPSTCQISGLVGADLSPLFTVPPHAVPIAKLSLTGVTASTEVTLAAGQVFGGTRQINQISVVSLANIGVVNEYVATAQVDTQIFGRAITNRNPVKTFYLNVVLDPSHKIVNCGVASAAPPAATPPPATPTPSPTPTPFPTLSPPPSAGGTILVVHGQSQPAACPAGWSQLWAGYSFAGGGSGTDVSATSYQDLGSSGSCLQQFYPVPYVESQGTDSTRAFYLDSGSTKTTTGSPRTAFTLWLYSRVGIQSPQPKPSASNYGYSPAKTVNISPCVVCSKPAPVVVVHSQTTLVPACPAGWTSLWSGYSLVGMTQADANNVGSLGSTGSCLKEFAPSAFIECGANDKNQSRSYGDYCHYGQDYDYTAWLSSSYLGSNPRTFSGAAILNQISRCSVCSQ